MTLAEYWERARKLDDLRAAQIISIDEHLRLRGELQNAVAAPLGIEPGFVPWLPKPEMCREEASDSIEYHFKFGEEHAIVPIEGKLLRHCGDRAKVIADTMACEFKELLKKFRQPPGLGEIAYAVFCSDPDVIAFATAKSESYGRGCVGPESDVRDPKQYERALRIAWERDENGWAARAQRRAWTLHQRLYGEAK